MNIILLGPPGAGKGTQARFICDTLGMLKISTGDILRSSIQAGTALGLAAKSAMDAGELVSDPLIIELVKIYIGNTQGDKGFVFDGFPRTLFQAEALQTANIVIDHVIELVIADEVIVKRLSGRWTHLASGRSYHVDYCPSKIIGKDDLTGDQLIQRFDDQEQTIRSRLKIYHQQTKPLLNFYQKLAQQGMTHYSPINALGDVEAIKQRILAVLTS